MNMVEWITLIAPIILSGVVPPAHWSRSAMLDRPDSGCHTVSASLAGNETSHWTRHQVLNDRVLAIFGVGPAGPRLVQGFIVLLRVQGGWGGAANSPTVPQHSSAIVKGQILQDGSYSGATAKYAWRVDYSFGSDSIHVLGRAFSLAGGNVLMVDRFDSIGGPPIVSIGGCIAAQPSASFLDRAISGLAAVRSFLH
jgi:hypothetical protein